MEKCFKEAAQHTIEKQEHEKRVLEIAKLKREKWAPFISIGISIVALAISIVALCVK